MLEEFKSTLGKRGFARPSLFRVEIVKQPNLFYTIQGINEILRDLHFFSEAAEIPGTQIMTQEIRYYDMPEKIAYGKVHDDLNITFRLDKDFQVKRVFDAWVNSIYNRKTGNIFFKKDYVGTIQIYQIMENGYSSYAVELEDAYPIQIGQISLSWDQAGVYSTLPVTFSFKRMRIIANKLIFRKPKKSQTNVIEEQTIDESLTNTKTNLSSIINQDSTMFRQIKVSNKIGYSNLVGEYDYL